MTTNYEFVDNIDELISSTLEFYGKPEFWKAAIGNGPRYFVHVKVNGIDVFGLSKFCAFKNIIVEDYLRSFRYKTDGGTTQKHIAWLTGVEWSPIEVIKKDVRKSFENWISPFFPNYNTDNASFISLKVTGKARGRKRNLITPQDLLNSLKLQTEIGQVGEAIAMKFEIQRLKELGIKKPEAYVDQVSVKNTAAGYDIYSSTKIETRYIEVKSSLIASVDFFITENEVITLEELGREAFLYFVQITDLAKKEGHVHKIQCDPIEQLRRIGRLTPIAYRASLTEK
ncbi:DUF3883 domain-containing protein [Pseudoflavitalea sp. G-6-1-2]|uniref:DUF3883 domain-containing protein n=1 Tax=Pseudoflavitalea sp. G-6-1-2 TaxID=2728841 RepID=UPI00146CCA75|nr:DUF3883 domain-containing protein [Pseudoflavitalea sp. G-6-1-2]NML24031.1 DUF3883 domain-containing protein [Pseudoflavitalea sp. G-6-1-2]